MGRDAHVARRVMNVRGNAHGEHEENDDCATRRLVVCHNPSTRATRAVRRMSDEDVHVVHDVNAMAPGQGR